MFLSFLYKDEKKITNTINKIKRILILCFHRIFSFYQKEIILSISYKRSILNYNYFLYRFVALKKHKKMKKIVVLSTVLFVMSCTNSQKTEKVIAQEVIIQKFGDKNINEEGVITGKELMTLLETQDSVQVKVITTISDVCQKKGCWMEVDLDGNNQMLVRFLDYGFFMPLDASGSTAIIEGVAKVDILSVAWLKHQKEDANASQEEIDAVTEPEISYSIEEATGVILK